METLKAIGRKWNDISLIKRILVGLVIGAVLGVFLPGNDVLEMFGTLFVSALKGVAPILVFFLVISALANAKGAGAMKVVVILYLAATFIAAFVAVLMSSLFPVELTLAAAQDTSAAPSDIGSVFSKLLLSIASNPVDALTNANYLGILAWAVLLGIALRHAKDGVKEVFASISDAVSQVVRWIISLAPFGIMGLVYTSVSTNGLEIFTEYGQLLLVLLAAMAVVAFVTNPLLAFACFRKNPYPLVWRCTKDSGVTAFFTRSSAANIPVNMELCKKLGLNKDSYSVSIPLGATINMGGAAVTISLMAMMAAHTMGIEVGFGTAVILGALSAVSACGASGVAGGSLLLIPLACSLFGIGNDVAMQVVGIGFVIGVIQDSVETAINSSTDVLFAASAEYMQWRREGRDFKPGADA
ncbi:serine/threonine transporter SstT [Senegalimassilia anaerobia]|uniref:serine/threonine transporter SstT n=1 Tax=Senegalimassilia anaerobia TaxID=1473216 RepID=UPI001DF3B6DD|nr:serine/threonine transporter SstT [Senegalimassilia anaerobia]MBD9214771.1 serine/threonine transporter SstT [Senegalimassilia anaerobia]